MRAKASAADVHFTIDAEEADRLELQMDMFEALLADDSLFANGWGGLRARHPGLSEARRAAVPTGSPTSARAHGRKLMVRLVKGAYWDTEIKAAQVAGLPDYPVFTRKVATDVSYLACAKMLLGGERRRSIPPSPPTTRTPSARSRRWPAARRSNSSGCTAWARRCTRSWPSSSARSATAPTPVRIYAPVGSHKELLAYLVRRLLENGANSSFVNRIADEQVSLDELVRDPVAELEALEPKRNPAIVAAARDLRRRSAATAPASICPTRWCASRCWSG